MEKPTIVWFSNSPTAPTGYGVVTKNIVFPLHQRGYKISVVAFWGCEGAAMQVQGVTIYPRRFDLYGKDAAQIVLDNLKPDIFITLFDVWVGAEWLPKLHPRWVAWVPVDHQPIPQPVYDVLRYVYKPVAMSKFGFDEMMKADLRPRYIPHGVDTKVFHPIDKRQCREKLGFKEDQFIVGINAANKGTRKDFARMFLAFKKFLDDNPDAVRHSKLYMNTYPRFPEGLDLSALSVYMGLKDHTIVTSEFRRYIGISDQGMAEFYNTHDVFLNLARGEGFGIPIIEAQACGVPVIATDFSSMPELVKGHGWLISPVTFDITPLLANQAIANVNDAAQAIEEAYNKPDLRETYSKASLEFAQQYDYEQKIIPMWERLLREIAEDIEAGKKIAQAVAAK